MLTIPSLKRLLFVVSFLLVTTASISAQSAAYTDGQTAQLSDQQKAKLFKLKTAIAVPTYLPAGFRLEEVTAETVPDAPGVCSYNLVYTKGKGQRFTIQAANDGIGSVDMSKTIQGRNPYFDGIITVGLDEDKSVFAEWISSKKQFLPKGIKYAMNYSLTTSSLSRQEVLKIMQSLRYLKK